MARPNLRRVEGPSNDDAAGAEELASRVGEYIGFAAQMRGGRPHENGPFAQGFGHFDRIQAELRKRGAKLEAVSSQLRSAEASRLGLEEQKRYLSALADERASAVQDAADRYQQLEGEAEGLRDERARLEESARGYLEKMSSDELRIAALETEKNSLEEQRQYLEDKILQLREMKWWKLASLRLFRRRWNSETDPSIGLHKNENSKD